MPRRPKPHQNQFNHHRLVKFDFRYFDAAEEWAKTFTVHDAAYMLATYLYDHDFDIDEESWELLMLVKTTFPDIYDIVVEYLFTRQHDT